MADRTLNVKITGDPRSLERALGRSQTQLQAFGRQVNTTSKGLRGLAFAPSLQIAGIGAAVAGLTAASKASIDFGRELRNVNSIAGLTEPQLDALADSIRNLSPQVGKGPVELAQGLYDIVSSGFDAADAMKILEASAVAATAGLSNTATATRAVSAILNAYHLSASDAREVSDQLFQEVNLGVNTFEDLANNIGDVVPQASALKIPFEQVAAALATITLGGTPIAEASTQLSRVFAALVKPSKGLAAELKKLGYETGQAAVASEGFDGVLAKLSRDAGGNQQILAEWLGDIRGIRGVINLTGQNLGTYREKLVQMGDATEGAGAAQKAFAEQSKSAAFQLDRARAAAEAAATNIGSALEPVIADLASSLADAVTDVSSLVTALKDLGNVKIPPIKIPFVPDFSSGGGRTRDIEIGGGFTAGDAAGVGGTVLKFLVTRTGPFGFLNTFADLTKNISGGKFAQDVANQIAQQPTGGTSGPRGRGSLIPSGTRLGPQTPTTTTTAPPTSSAGLVTGLPNRLVQQLLDAQISGSQKAVLDALKEQAAFLNRALQQKKLSKSERTGLKEQLISVNSAMDGIVDGMKSRAKALKDAADQAAEQQKAQAEADRQAFQQSLTQISPKLELGAALAGLTSGIKDDVSNLKAQLRELLANLSKATSDEVRAAIVNQIKGVEDALANTKNETALNKLDKVQAGREAFRRLRDAKKDLALQLKIGGDTGILKARENLQDAQTERKRLSLQGVTFATPTATASTAGVNQQFGDVQITINSNQNPDDIARAVARQLRQRSKHGTSQPRGRNPGVHQGGV